MSEEARNSIYLWLITVAVFGAFWLGLHFNVLGDSAAYSLRSGLLLLLGLNVGRTTLYVWRHYAARRDNSERG